MWSSAFFVRVVLGLLSSLVVAAASIHVAGEDLPVNSTLDYPFTLTTRSPTGFHVVLNSDLRPVVTLDRRASTKFRLTNGNLTVLDSELTAIYGSTPIPFPPPLIPVVFTKNPRSGAILPFLAETNNREKGILTLTALGENLVVRIPVGVQNHIYVKPEGNIAPTEHIILEIRPVQKAADCHDGHGGQEFLLQDYGL